MSWGQQVTFTRAEERRIARYWERVAAERQAAIAAGLPDPAATPGGPAPYNPFTGSESTTHPAPPKPVTQRSRRRRTTYRETPPTG